MAIQTLNTIKEWFKSSLKPTQTQFWDTWDSFRHKYEKIPVKDVENLDKLLNYKVDKSDFKTINGQSVLGVGDIVINSGGSQNLNQVLESGNIVLGKEIILTDEENTTADSSNGRVMKLKPNGFEFTQYTENGGPYAKGVSINSDGLHFSNGNNGLPYRTTLRSLSPDTPVTLFLPEKNGTLATIDDITESDSQTLQQILSTGNTDTTGNSIVMKTDWNESKIKSDSISISYGNEVYPKDSFSLHSEGDGGMIDYTDVNGNGNVLNFTKFNGEEGAKSTFFFPEKSGTLATYDDITFQRALSNGNNATDQPFYQEYKLSDDISLKNGVIGTFDVSNNIFPTTGVEIDFSVSGKTNVSRVGFSTGGDIIRYYEYSDNPSSNRNLTFKLPEQLNPNWPYTNIYTLATIDDIRNNALTIFDSFATTSISSTDLNSAYSHAKPGDKVNCFYILPSPIQYEKTYTGWIAHAISLVD